MASKRSRGRPAKSPAPSGRRGAKAPQPKSNGEHAANGAEAPEAAEALEDAEEASEAQPAPEPADIAIAPESADDEATPDSREEPGETEPAWVKLNTPAQEEIAILTTKSEASNAARQLYPQGVFTINDTKVVAVSKGTSYLKIAEENDLSLARLLEFNDLKDGDVTTEDGLLYLQRKRKTGVKDFHVVADGETLHGIAQTQGIRLESLLEYNQLSANAAVEVGETLYLKSQAPSRPKLAGLFGWLKGKEQPAAEPAAAKEERPAPQIIVHVVQPKDTVFSIARKYEVGVDDVKKWNAMQSTDLKIGQQLKITKSR